MKPSARYLTKSRFKLALECPTKLYYVGKLEYLNNSLDNSFLAALAEGGYQVGALACLMYPGGETVHELGHEAALARTHELLSRDDVTIYEAALEADGLFVRVDILRKRGQRIELVEVKAKSYDAASGGDFRGSRGALKPEYLPYLRDIAFQRYVAGLALPQFEYQCFLMMADTSRVATVDGLNQRFRVRRDGSRIAIDLADGTDLAALGEPILTAVDVDQQVSEILSGDLPVDNARRLPFADAVKLLADAYSRDQRIRPAPSAACGACEFKAAAAAPAGEARSGFHECWSEAFGLNDADIARGTVLDLWNFRKKDELIRAGRVRLADVQQDDVGFDGVPPTDDGMTAKHRQWYQVHGDWPGGGDFYLAIDELQAAMRTWRYPLHFIDFETSAVPIPFSSGCRPYQPTAFQFSHHVMHEDGQVEHRSQFLDATPGTSPNVPFLRALREALRHDEGTVFRWAAHENTVLNQLRRQLLDDPHPPVDRDQLVEFIESLTIRRNGNKVEWQGRRPMVDLCKAAEKFFFHPATRGSSSLKKVLPALMRSSAFLRETYSRPVYGSPAMPSLNLSGPVCWWQEKDGQVLDPYKLLPPVFADLSREDQDALDAGLAPELQEGGAAMAAYALLQSGDVAHPDAIKAALLRYCELDTLAMVMAVQAWKAWVEERKSFV